MRRRGGLVATTNWHTPQYSPLATDEGALAELIRAALQLTTVRLDLSFVDEASGVVATCARVARAERFHHRARTMQRSPHLEIEGEWSAYEAGLPSRKTGKYRRFRRRLEEQGEVAFELSDGGTRLDELHREGFRVEAAGYEERAERGTPILARPETTRFYTEVPQWAAERGWLRLWMLRLDGAPIAFAYGLEHGGVYFDLKLGFDPRFSRFGPGVLLMRERFQHAFTASLERFEFLGAAERHKLDWTDTCHELPRIQRSRPPFRGWRAGWRGNAGGHC